eukprot:3460347-Pleurochrysis_carterae.AAC.2
MLESKFLPRRTSRLRPRRTCRNRSPTTHSKRDTPSTPQLVKDYEIAVRKEHYVNPTFQKNDQSKVGALIYAPTCGRPGETFAIGILARALTFDSYEGHGRPRE